MNMTLAIITGGVVVLVLATRTARRSGTTRADLLRSLPGDEIIPEAGYIADRAAVIRAPAEEVWPWLVQLGRSRAGWYAPEWLERLMRRKHLWGQKDTVHPEYQHLKVGDIVPDWAPGSLKVVEMKQPRSLVYVSVKNPRQTNNYTFSWSHVLEPIDDTSCRIYTRLRMRRSNKLLVRASILFLPLSGFFDYLVISALYAGLKERVEKR